MSVVRSSGVSAFIRGGQLLRHFWTMLRQVVATFGGFALGLFGLFVAGLWYKGTSAVDRYYTWKYIVANFWTHLTYSQDATVVFGLPDGSSQVVPADAVLRSPEILESVQTSSLALAAASVGAFVIVAVLAAIGVYLVYRSGTWAAADQYLRGSSLVDSDTLCDEVRAKREHGRPITGKITIAGVPIPRSSEPFHFLMVGSTGSGKSQCFLEIMRGVRKERRRAIVYDASGDFISAFYRPEKDIILNPLDARGAPWNVWAECTEDYHYDKLAAALVPDSHDSDPFWTSGARIVLSALARKMAEEGTVSNTMLVDAILRVPLKHLISYLSGTEAGSVLSKGSEKIATSIRAVLATYAVSLKYLRDDEEPFSIRKWVQSSEDSEDDSWIFISMRDEQSEALRPLVTAWIDTAASALLSLSVDRDRRIWIFIDELTDLNKLVSLSDILNKSRKYGGCAVLGVQAYSQLCTIYGRDAADTIAGGCTTWTVLRLNENRSAEWASKDLGQVENNEVSENVSYGAHQMRDGVGLNAAAKLRSIVLPSELTGLPDLKGFLKLGKEFPIARIKVPIQRLSQVAPPFVMLEEAFTSRQRVDYLPTFEQLYKDAEGDSSTVAGDVDGASSGSQMELEDDYGDRHD